MFLKLFAVMYIKGHLASAMLLWPGATTQDCQRVNTQYMNSLPVQQRTNVHMTCEMHFKNPVKNKVKF